MGFTGIGGNWLSVYKGTTRRPCWCTPGISALGRTEEAFELHSKTLSKKLLGAPHCILTLHYPPFSDRDRMLD